ncbi:MAG: transpeptidase family protein [Dysgonamonadaceae bacterium]|jgi:cell division protein FtsI (penicillin-binding protein 3)|nr:transpeptidase family protein [Dysgonamonadaceae bacterium]
MDPSVSTNKKIIVRYFVIAVLFILFAVLIFAKACIISFVDGNAWRKLGEKQIRPNVQVPAVRGDIYSCNRELMATTEEYYRLYVDFWAEGIQEDTLRKYVHPLSVALNKMFSQRSVSEYESHIMRGWNTRSPKNREYRLLDQAVNYLQLKAIRKMPFFNKGTNRSGLYTKSLVKRTKPYGTLASRTIGDIYADIDSTRKTGKNGLELQYDALLSGQPGTSTRRKVNGKWINVMDVKPVNGKDIVSTIDIHIQDITEKALLNKLREIDAESGTAVVMETATGEIKAITNMGRIREGVWGETKNYAVSDLSEPGSTFKVVSMMVALEDGLVRPDDPVDTGNGIEFIAGHELRDHNANRGGYGTITAAKSIRYSSNIGVAKLIMQAYNNNPGKYVDGIYRIGFHKDMHLEIPGYGIPRIRHPKDTARYWSRSTLPWMSFGYETQVPPIYTLSFFNAIANNGKLVKPIFVKEIQENGHCIEKKKTEVINSRICSSSTLTFIRQMLDDVVNCSDGTGKPACSDKIRISGKTGTAQLSQGSAGYKAGGLSHQVSFCGYFPSDDPQYSMIIVIRKPRNGPASGGMMCGTVFKTIAEEIYSQNMITHTKDFPVDTLHPAEAVVKKSLEDLKVENGLVPNVKGMGAKNAVYAMENAGLRVHLTGRGTVTAQSIPPGSAAVKGQTVGLQLK